MEYKDKVAVVTSGAHGIGMWVAEEFRKRGVGWTEYIFLQKDKLFWKMSHDLRQGADNFALKNTGDGQNSPYSDA